MSSRNLPIATYTKLCAQNRVPHSLNVVLPFYDPISPLRLSFMALGSRILHRLPDPVNPALGAFKHF